MSDFHFKKNVDDDANEVLQELLSDVASELKRVPGRKLDFIAFTGDLVYSGQKEEFDRASQFLDKLVVAAELPLERLFVVPGNHDADRSSHASAIFAALRHAKNEEDYREAIKALLDGGAQQAVIARRLESFFNFTHRFPGTRHLSPNRFWYVDQFDTASGTKVGIAGLASCWASGEDKEDELRYLAVGSKQIRDVMQSLNKMPAADLQVFLLHHPFDALQRFDAAQFHRTVAERGDVLLRGHLHDTAFGVQQNPDGGFVELAAGSGYEHRWSRNGYLFVQAEIATSEIVISVHARAWSKKGYFAADTESYRQGRNNGEFQLRLTRRKIV